MTTIKDTGWCDPHKIAQCTTYQGKNFAKWFNIDPAKLDEPNTQRHYDLSAVTNYVVSANKPTAILYAYGYNFNIPATSIIKKVELRRVVCADDITRDRVKDSIVKLKVGASVSDYGVGNNKSEGTTWVTHAYAHRNGMQYITTTHDDNTSVKDFWGVELTPEMVNNENFGMLTQMVGTGSSGHKLYLDAIQIKITYAEGEVNTIVQKPVVDPEYFADNVGFYRVSRADYGADGGLNDEYGVPTATPLQYTEATQNLTKVGNNPIPLWLQIKIVPITDENGVKRIPSGKTVPVALICDENSCFTNGKQVRIVGSRKFEGSSDKHYLEEGLGKPGGIYHYIRFGIKPTVDIESLTSNSITTTISVRATKKVNGEYVPVRDKTDYTVYREGNQYSWNDITLTYTLGETAIPDSMTIIRNCKFIDNHANKGGAIYNTGRLYTSDLTFKNNTTKGEYKDNCEFKDVDICRKWES